MGGCCLSTPKEKPEEGGKPLETDESPARKRKGSRMSLRFGDNFKPWDPSLYKMGRLIGKGSFAEVLTAKRNSDNLDVAIKRIVLRNLSQEEITDIENEVVILTHLEHENIVKFIERYEDKKYVYLVMELVKGPVLYDRVLERAIRKDQLESEDQVDLSDKDRSSINLLTEDSLSEYIKQILSALEYMHNGEIIHGDIKPENMVFESKTSKKLKLVDFGYAVQRNKCKFLDIPRGTPIYMAPEYLNGKYTESVDVWAVGIISFEILYGYPPFTSKWMKPKPLKFNPMKTVKFASQGLQEDQPGKGPWCNTEIKISEDAKSFIKKLLTVDPSRRPTAHEALHLPWICNDHDFKFNPAAAKSLLNYSNLSDIERFFKPFLTDIEKNVDAHVLRRFENTFKRMDPDNTGYIEFHTFCETMKQFGIDFPNLQMQQVFDGLDTAQEGKVSYKEFLEWFAWHHVTVQDDRMWIFIAETFGNEKHEISLEAIHNQLETNPDLSDKIPPDCLKALEMLFEERDVINVDELLEEIHYENGELRVEKKMRESMFSGDGLGLLRLSSTENL